MIRGDTNGGLVRRNQSAVNDFRYDRFLTPQRRLPAINEFYRRNGGIIVPLVEPIIIGLRLQSLKRSLFRSSVEASGQI